MDLRELIELQDRVNRKEARRLRRRHGRWARAAGRVTHWLDAAWQKVKVARPLFGGAYIAVGLVASLRRPVLGLLLTAIGLYLAGPWLLRPWLDRRP